MWWIFSAMCPNKLEPLVKKIDYDIDIEARRGSTAVADTFETSATPILNPVTGEEHRVRIDLPNGFEYAIAEIASGTTRSSGAIQINIDNTYAQFNELHLTNTGVIREAA